MKGTVEDIEAEAARCLEIFAGRGYVLSGGCALPITTPMANVRALVSAAEHFSQGRP
jgi:uroporphyrinogen-III decarboxylase